jgi:uncharacterized protein (TIGR03083 family)
MYTPGNMNVSEHIDAIDREGAGMLAAARTVSLDAAIPTCAGWQVRTALVHLGTLHRWLAAIVGDALMTPPSPREVAGSPPDDSGLRAWFAAGHARMVQVLREAPDDLVTWSVFPDLPSRPFWARRQAHEHGIHRADVESASGVITPFGPAMAADGIDELLFLLTGLPTLQVRSEEPRIFHVRADDVGRDWFIHTGPEGTTVSAEGGTAGCTVTGPASDLFLLLWNRKPADGLAVGGDPSLLDIWRASARI